MRSYAPGGPRRIPAVLAALRIAPWIWLLAAPSTAARGAAVEEAYPLPDTVLVQSTKIPFQLRDLAASATIVPAGRIRAGGASEIRTILDGVAGLHSFDLSGTGDEGVVESRGFTSFGETSYLMVLADGFPLADLENDAVDWSLLSPAQVERVEILHGPIAALYGNSSMAGVINLITWDPDGPSRFWAEGGAGSDRDYRSSLGVSGRGRALAGSISATRRTSAGWRDHSGAARTGGTGILEASLSTGWRLRSRLILNHSRREVPGPLPDSIRSADPRRSWEPFAGDDRRADLLLPSLEVRGRLGPSSELTARVGGEVRDVEATETIYPAGTMERESRSRGGFAEGRLHMRPGPARGFELLLGAEAGRGRLRSRYFEADGPEGRIRVGAGDVDRLSGSAFAWMQVRPLRLWRLNAGIRWDGSRSELGRPDSEGTGPATQDLSAVSPAVGISREVAGAGVLYASAAGSFKAPTLEQLFDQRPFRIPGAGIEFTLSNEALRPQRGFHLDLGGRARIESRARLDGAVYYAKSTDEIGFDLSRFRYDNIEESTHYGFEGNAAVLLLDRSELRIAYTYTRARFDGGPHDGNQINGVPKHRVAAALEAAPMRGTSVTLSAAHVREQWLDEDNRFDLPPTTFVDLVANRRFGRIALIGAARNLLDEDRPSAGYLTIDPQGRDLPLAYPPAGRRFEIGVRIDTSAGNG